MLQELRTVLSVRKAERERMKVAKSLAKKRSSNDDEPKDNSVADNQADTNVSRMEKNAVTY